MSRQNNFGRVFGKIMTAFPTMDARDVNDILRIVEEDQLDWAARQEYWPKPDMPNQDAGGIPYWPDTLVPVARPENEAAERLREAMEQRSFYYRNELDAALATERRLTVERYAPVISDHPMWIERRVCNTPGCDGTEYFAHIDSILDEEANR